MNDTSVIQCTVLFGSLGPKGKHFLQLNKYGMTYLILGQRTTDNIKRQQHSLKWELSIDERK